MFYVLVKFHGHPAPELFATSHVSHAARLATMDDVEWVSPTIGGGSALAYTAATGGGHDTSTLGEHRIKGYKPEDSE